ncbi:MAG: zinc ribbon domain-containing protein [Gammaproteobacteria bacterium]
MPIFDYQCAACGHAFDALQKAGEGPLRKCPECGKLKLKKQLAAPNFHLKGSGWYKTDFKDKSAKKDGDKSAGKSDSPSGDKSGEKSGGKDSDKSDSKADAKKGHTMDSGPAHSHDSGHSHSHGGHSHNHGPGGHKH